MRHLIKCAFCTLFFAQGVCAAAQVHNTQSEELYLLTGTETNSGSDAYPVNLYKVDSQGKVALVRTIVQPNQGLFSIRDDQEGHLVIAYPHVVPTNVSVIDKRSPLSSHVSGVNPSGNTVISTAWSVAATDVGHTYVLLPFAKDDTPLDYAMSGVSLIKGAFQPLPAQPWSLYKDLRYDGQPGGGQFDAELQATLSSSEISLAIGGQLVQICAGPSSFTKEELNAPVSLVALSSRYVVFSFTRTRAEMETGSLKPRKVYVGDRVTGAWKQLEMTSDSPRIRMLGTWLAVIEEDWSPNNETNPGRDSERSSRTKDVPSTRDEYATFQGSNYKITGHLSLISLIDGTVMRINTGQEDSEIEAVHGDDVIYRVNDALMIANMRGTTVGPAHTIAKSDVIPEVHWVFFK